MLRAAAPFVLGLILAQWAQVPLWAGWVLVAVLFAGWLIVSLGRQTYARRWANGVAFMAGMAGLGFLWQTLFHDRAHPDHLGHWPEAAEAWQVVVTDPPLDNGRSIRAWAVAESACVQGTWRPARGGLLLTLLPDSLAATPVQGDKLLVHGQVESIGRVPTPGGFDARRWAASRGVAHQIFLPAGHWRRINPVRPTPGIYATARAHINGWLHSSGLPDRERALVKALLLGQRDELQSDQTEAFVRSGTIHVLAVSGTHVGIIYGAVLWGLVWVSRDRRGRFWRGLVALIVLWNYAGITGFAPSVLRATVMFSLFTVAEMTRWRVESLNSLAAAAVLLLLWDPSMLGQLGFQLSFLAVLGIIVFYDPIARLWDPPNGALRFLWSLAAVSLAAQGFTAPLCLYAFHAFPVWFLPANMAVVGLIVVALYGGIILVMVQAVPVLGPTVSLLMKWLLLLLGGINDFFAWLPGAYPAVRIGTWGMLGLYGLIALMAFWFIQRARWARPATLAMLALLLGGWAWTARQRNQQGYFTAYPQRDGFSCAFVTGRTMHLYGTQGDRWTERTVLDHVRHAGIRTVVRHEELPCKVVMGDDQYLFLSDDAAVPPEEGDSGPVILLAAGGGGNAYGNGPAVAQHREWVVGAGVAADERRKLLRKTREWGEPVFDLRREGAYVRHP